MNFLLFGMALIFGVLNHGAIEMARAFIFSKPPGVRTVSWFKYQNYSVLLLVLGIPSFSFIIQYYY